MTSQSCSVLPALAPQPRPLDRQGWAALLAGALLLLISFTTNYGDDNLTRFHRLPTSTQQILNQRPDLLSAVLPILFERFPTLTLEKIMVIAGIPSKQLLHTRAALAACCSSSRACAGGCA